ncbi:AAA family ATPase [Candidatus Roizmanbacteria bacterium]|nr:AAA family ATPase [Candidatus Roizmanbacteria bacterium]
MKLVLMGIQGAGKSTQGNLLSKQFKIPYLSTGHIFREIAKEKTKLGRYLKELINAGILIPDDKTIEIVNSYLSRPEYKKGYILDGFPRTIAQCEQFVNNVDHVVCIELDDKEALWRLAYRNENRDDNTLQAIIKRIELFHTVTEPVVQYYREKGILIEIDGSKSIEEVNDEILKSLGRQVVADEVKTWEQKKKSIIAIVGLPGSGKTEAADFFKAKKLPVISFGKIINDLVDNQGLAHTEEVHKKLREGLREQYGNQALAVMNKNKIEDALKNSKVLIIDGLRSWEEYIYLKQEFPEVKIKIISLFADKTLRYKRLSQRKDRAGFYGEDRDMDEVIRTNMGPTIAFADFLIKNNYSKDELFDKLEEAYRAVYFS